MRQFSSDFATLGRYSDHIITVTAKL